MILKTVAQEKLPELAQLASKIWNEHYPSIIGQQQVDYMLNKMYALPALEEQIKEGQQFFFLEVDGEICGFISVSNKEAGHYFIHKFYVDVSLHRKGIGSKAMKAIEEKFPDWKSFTLTVNRFNIKAINFYFKQGFVIDHVADFDIGEGYVMNDFVMVKKR